MERMLEERLRHSALLDLYGALLTERQRRCLEMSLFDDYSLSEIGEGLGVSRQAVHDIIRRAGDALEEYEERLGLLGRREAERAELLRVYEALKAMEPGDEAARGMILSRLAGLLGREDIL